MAVEENEVVADPKYGQLKPDIVEMLRSYEYEYFREDKPVPFCGLYIHPAQVRDYEVFSNCCGCLTLNKNEDPKGITLSHLDYLIYKMQIKENNEGQVWSYKLQKLFEIIFHLRNGLKCKKCGHIIGYGDKEFLDFKDQLVVLAEVLKDPEKAEEATVPSLKCPKCQETDFLEMIKIIQDPVTKKNNLLVDGHVITNKDFVNLRQIVLYQNYPDYVDDSWVDPAIKRDHDERMRLEQKKNDLHASIEKKVICLSVSTNYSLNSIWDMPIRKFTMALSTVDDLINYKIMKQATLSGFVSMPKGKTVEHWIYKPNKDMYGDSYKSTDEIKNSASGL